MLLNVVLLAVTVYLGLCAGLYLFQSTLIYFPSKSHYATPKAAGLEYEDVWLTTADGVRIHGWFVFHPEPRGTLLFFHGNAGNIGDRIESLQIFNRLGLNSLIIDYHGYGLSGGSAGEQETRLDAKAAWDHLTTDRGIPPEDIVVFGRSLGGGVAAWLASETNPAGLILESSFTSVPDLAAKYYPLFPVRLLARVRYDSKAALSRIRCPVLIVHSVDDEIVPFSHGRALFDAAPPSRFFLELRGGHNDGFLRAGDWYVNGLSGFLDRALAPVPGPAAAAHGPKAGRT